MEASPIKILLVMEGIRVRAAKIRTGAGRDEFCQGGCC